MTQRVPVRKDKEDVGVQHVFLSPFYHVGPKRKQSSPEPQSENSDLVRATPAEISVPS